MRENRLKTMKIPDENRREILRFFSCQESFGEKKEPV